MSTSKLVQIWRSSATSATSLMVILRNLKFDGLPRAQHVITFIETFCHHSQGEWAGQKVEELAPLAMCDAVHALWLALG